LARFFINRPVVAMVISMLTVIIGIVAMVQLPVALYPNIAPPEILLTARYPGADAITLEQSVATPIEQQMSGVDKMLYMYSLNQSSGNVMQLRVNFDVTTDPSVDQVLTNLRYSQAASQLPPDVVNQGVTVTKSVTSPLGIFVLYSPKGTYDPLFLANYGYVNVFDPMTRVPGIGQVQIFGASQYAIRLWVNPDTLAKLDITVNEIASALQAQNTVNPAGQLGGDPVPPGQEFTYTVVAQGRLATVADFENVVVRAKPDGALVRVKDVARVELGAQNYIRRGRLNGRPAALIAIYQLPGSNAIETMKAATKLMEQIKTRFPADLDYVTSLDTTLAVTAGIQEIVKTLLEALVLVVIVVFIFLQGFRATLIPLLAVPVALVGSFMVFPLLGFSINTLSLFGLVLAIGLVVDDAIVVVEAVERNIEEGLSPRDAAFKAMEQVSGPVVAIALILAAVFVPTAFIPGITGRMYQQFAVTIAVSVLLSAFNALTLSPALAALLLRPRREMRGPLGAFFRGFNRVFARATDGYVGACAHLIRKSAFSMILLLVVAVFAGLVATRLPGGFVPDEDQGFFYVNVQLPLASSLDRTAAVNDKLDAIFKATPGIKHYTGVAGFSLLSLVSTSYNSFYFITLEEWDARNKHGLTANAIIRQLNQKLAGVPEAQAFAFSPPAIPGIGTSGGVTFMLEDRAGRDLAFLAANTDTFLAAARKRPEFARLFTTMLPAAHRRPRRRWGALDRPTRARRLFPDRPRHGDRPCGQERHPHRRVRQGGIRARRVARGCRTRRSAHPAPADPHDRLRLHPRRASARHLDGRGGEFACDPRRDGPRRHARRDAPRRLHHPGHVLRERALRARAARGAAGRADARADQRRDGRRPRGRRERPMTYDGTLTQQRMYQLIRQPTPISDRQFEIEFLEAGAAAFAFTFRVIHGVGHRSGQKPRRHKEDDMITMRRSAPVLLTIAFFAVTVIGCASTGTTTPVAVKDFSAIAGKWSGWIRTTGSGSIPATFELTPAGDYVTRTEGYNTQGKAQIKDGALVLVGTSGSGRLGVSARTSTASITERSGGMLVMTGTGRDDIGPFDFEFTKQK
jgi:multidrug efflux pump subunit AcrB